MVRAAVEQFFEQIQSEELHPEQLGLDLPKDEAIALLRQVYVPRM